MQVAVRFEIYDHISLIAAVSGLCKALGLASEAVFRENV